MPPKAKAVVVASRRIQVTVYDRASSLLLALLFTIGLIAVVLFILWLSNKIHVKTVAVDTEIIEVSEDGEGGGDGRAAGGSQLDTPSEEPFVGHDKETTDIQENLSVLGNSEAKHWKVVMVLDAGSDAGMDEVQLAVDDES